MSGRRGQPQLTLDLFNVARHDFASFVAGPNAEALAAVTAWAQGAGANVLHLRGAAASGKSHLLQAAIAAAGHGAMYVPLRELLEAGAGLLEDLDSVTLIALDDIDVCVGRDDWERGLFNLYNAVTVSGRRLLWSARAAPAFRLPDLASRLRASLTYQLHELADADKALVLRARARARGLSLPETVIEFIMLRERRDLATLVALLDELDAAALAGGRAITVPLVREVLAARVEGT